MDLIGYSEQQYNQIKADFNRFLNSLQVYPLKYIPVSAFLGENITVRSENMPWYQGEPVLEALDLFSKETGLEDKPLRFPIQDVYKFDDRRIIAGRIESGKLKVGDEILISPGHKTTRVKSIEYWTPRDKTTTIQAGMSVGITVSDEFFNKRGEFISHLHDQPLTANTFKANLFWMGRNDLVKGKKYKIKLTTQEVEGEIISINQVVDASTLENIADAQAVKINDVAEVIIKTKQRVCFDQFKDNQNTGRFVVVDGYDVCGGGIIAGVEAAFGTEEVAGQTGSEVAGSKSSKVERLITRADRENRDNQKGLVVWVSGPGQGAGGETAAQDKFAVTLEKELFDLRKRVYFLDNAQLGSGLNSDLTNKDTDEQTRRKGEIARLFADNGLITIVTAHGQLKEDQHYAQLIIGRDNLLEVKLEQTAADKLDQKVEEVINLIVCGLDSSNL
jgi:bifunctional enzyme CysN/CysC/sulfate adenylyltransferase subunit 1